MTTDRHYLATDKQSNKSKSTFSDMPKRFTIAVAILVACWKSAAAPTQKIQQTANVLVQVNETEDACSNPVLLKALTSHVFQHGLYRHKEIDWLGFNGTFSTTRLYRAFEKYV